VPGWPVQLLVGLPVVAAGYLGALFALGLGREDTMVLRTLVRPGRRDSDADAGRVPEPAGPVPASGGAAPVSASGGAAPVSASGGAGPVPASGGAAPVSAPGGAASVPHGPPR
jgi:hypothetical protein